MNTAPAPNCPTAAGAHLAAHELHVPPQLVVQPVEVGDLLLGKGVVLRAARPGHAVALILAECTTTPEKDQGYESIGELHARACDDDIMHGRAHPGQECTRIS